MISTQMEIRCAGRFRSMGYSDHHGNSTCREFPLSRLFRLLGKSRLSDVVFLLLIALSMVGGIDVFCLLSSDICVVQNRKLTGDCFLRVTVVVPSFQPVFDIVSLAVLRDNHRVLWSECHCRSFDFVVVCFSFSRMSDRLFSFVFFRWVLGVSFVGSFVLFSLIVVSHACFSDLIAVRCVFFKPILCAVFDSCSQQV